MPLTITGENYREFSEPRFFECETPDHVRAILQPVEKSFAVQGTAAFGAVTLFKFSKTSAAVDDNLSVLKPNNPAFAAAGRWLAVLSGNPSNSGPRVVNVDDYGAVGNGITDDTVAIQKAAAALQSFGGGDLVFGRLKQYNVASATSGFQSSRSDGALNTAGIYEWTGTKAMRLVGNGATILPGSTTKYGTLFLFTGCSQVTVRDLIFKSTYQALDDSHGVEWLAFRQGCSGVILQNLDFQYGNAAMVFRGAFYSNGGVDTNRCRDILVQNVSINSTYYGLLCQGAGDNVFVRGLKGQNTGRVYFPINVKNHDVVVDGSQGGPFSDVLMKVYGTTQFYSGLENIKLIYNTSGRYPGSGPEGSGDTLVALQAGLNDAITWTGVTICNLDIQINARVSSADPDQGIFGIRKFDWNNSADTTPRGHLLRNVRLKIVASNIQAVLNQAVGICAWSSDDWTGDYIDGIFVQDSILRDCGVKLALIMDGRALTSSRQPIHVVRSFSDGTVALVNNPNSTPVVLVDSLFSNVTSGVGCFFTINGASIARATQAYPITTPVNFSDDVRLTSGSVRIPNNQGLYAQKVAGPDALMLSLTTGDHTLLQSPNDLLLSSPASATRIYTNAVLRLNVALNGLISMYGLTSYANNAAALGGGLGVGDLYRLGDTVGIVH